MKSFSVKTLPAVAVALCGLLMSCAPKAENFRMMSFNIRYVNEAIDTGILHWNARKGPALRMIRELSPDVIGFQEPHRPQVDFLTDSLPGYGHVELGRDEGVRPGGGEHLMIMYNTDKYEMTDHGSFWMSPTPEVVSKGWDAMCRRVTVWAKLKSRETGKELYFFDTHFDHIGKEARKQEAILLLAKMKEIAGGDAPVFVCGDFNMDTDDPSMAPLLSWMREAAMEAPGADRGSTFNGFGLDTRPLKIDHVFFRDAEAVSYRIVRDDFGVKYVSDHYPVLAEFEL